MRFLKVSIIFALYLFGFTPGSLSQGTNPFLVQDNWMKITLTPEMVDHLKKLENLEKIEQYRDWIKIAAANALGFTKTMTFQNFYDFNPLRSDYSKNISNYSFGEGRSLCGNNDSLYLIVPVNSLKKDAVVFQLVDNFRLINGRKPKTILLLEYIVDTIKSSASLAFRKQLSPIEIYSQKYGYFENVILNKSQLVSFLNSIDDIVHASTEGQGVRLGGRKYSQYNGKKIALEDIAVIYQAGNKLYENEIARLTNRGLLREYDDEIQYQVQYNIRKDSSILLRLSMAEIESQLREQITYDQFVLEFIEDLEKRRDDLNIGFSLDPAVKYREMHNALTKILRGDTQSLRRFFRNEIERDLIEQYQESTKQRSEYMESWLLREQSVGTMIGTDSARPELDPQIKDNVLADYLSGSFTKMRSAIQKNMTLLSQIASQLGNARNGKQLLHYYYLQSYLRGDFTIDLRIQRNERWNSEKQAIYQRAVSDLADVLYNLRYINSRANFQFDARAVELLNSLNRDYFFGREDFSALNEKELTKILLLDPVKQNELFGLQLFLNNIIKPYKYQKARYDGDFKGTKVGMTLFYTDLLMKLWSFDYKSSFPKMIPDFFPETNYRISSFYQDELKKNPYTRSWLGPLNSGIELYKAGREVYFAPTVTRIYNASSNDIVPGIEVPAHMSSERFSNWWNLHYNNVADYETEFHRLNQIMKWSFLVSWLKNLGQMDWLNYEDGLVRSLDFVQWYKTNTSLKVNVALPFLNKDSLHESGECIDILVSKPFVWFKDKNLEYVFSGGVSLASRRLLLQKMTPARTQLAGSMTMNRAGLRTMGSDNKALTILDTRYALDPSGFKVFVSPGKYADFKGRESEFRNLAMNRSVTFSKNILAINQSVANANPISMGGVMAAKTGNSIVISALKDDLGVYNNFLTNRTSSSYLDVSEKKVFLNEKTFLIKLDNTSCWAVGRELDDNLPARSNSGRPLLSYSDRDKRYEIEFIADAKMSASLLPKNWFKIRNQSYRVEYGDFALKSSRNSISISDGKYTNAALIGEDGVYIKQGNFKLDEAVAHTLSSYNGQSIMNAVLLDKSRIYVLKDDGVIRLSRGSVSGLDIEHNLIKSLTQGSNTAIKIIKVKPGETRIRFSGRGVLEIPSLTDLNQEQKEVIGYVLKKCEDPDWIPVFESARSLLAEDIQVLKTFKHENFSLASSYFPMKYLDNLDESSAMVNLHSVSVQPQVLIKHSKGLPTIINIESNRSMPDIINQVKAMSESRNTPENEAEVFQYTKDYADVIRTICDQTTATTLITMEPAGINSELVKRLHNIRPEINIMKDQPDIVTSVNNTYKVISVDFEKNALLMTIDPAKSGDFPVLKLIVDSLTGFGLKLNANLSSSAFLKILRDSTVRQLNLVVRGNSYGLVFADGFLDFWTLRSELSRLYRTRKKDVIYIISNVADTLETIFAAYPMFTRIVTSSFQLTDKVSLGNALLNLKAFYSKAYNEELNIPIADWKKLEQSNSDLKAYFGKTAKREKKQVVLQVGKMKSSEWAKIPPSVSSYLNEKLGGIDRRYKSKDLDKLLREVQSEKLLEFRLTPQKLNFRTLKTFPGLKAAIKFRSLTVSC